MGLSRAGRPAVARELWKAGLAVGKLYRDAERVKVELCARWPVGEWGDGGGYADGGGEAAGDEPAAGEDVGICESN